MALTPENYRENIDFWENHESVEKLRILLGLDESAREVPENEQSQDSSDDGDEPGEKREEEEKHIPVAKNAFSALMDVEDE